MSFRLSKGLVRLFFSLLLTLSTVLLLLSLRTAETTVDNGHPQLRTTATPDGGRLSTDQSSRSTVATPATRSTTTTNNNSSSRRAIAPPLLSSAITYTLGEYDICRRLRPQVFTLIYVHTAPSHFKHRSVIRRTFGGGALYAPLNTVTVFFLGRSLDLDLATALRAESQRYHDIIQGDYVDSYRNLSLKAISALKWLKDNCNNAKYVLKVDDDMFVNVFNLVRHLKYLSRYVEEQSIKQVSTVSTDNGVIHCLVWHRMSVLRNTNSKWYVTKEEYPENVYPSYCSGSAFFMESSLVPLLYGASSAAPFLWVDDVYATGLLAKEANVRHNSINSIVVFKAEEYDSKLIDGEAVFGHMTGDKGVDLRHQYWKKVLQKEEWAVT